jgi:hypothetical protein
VSKKASRRAREENYVWQMAVPDAIAEDESALEVVKHQATLQWLKACAAEDYKPAGQVRIRLQKAEVQMTWTDPETGEEFPLPNYMLLVEGRVQMQKRKVPDGEPVV